jgi:hypothetical protein
VDVSTPDVQAICPIGRVTLAVPARRVESIWDPVSDPTRAPPGARVDLASAFALGGAGADLMRRRLDVRCGAAIVTLIAGVAVEVGEPEEEPHPLPELVAGLAAHGVSGFVIWRGRYAYLLVPERLRAVVSRRSAP